MRRLVIALILLSLTVTCFAGYGRGSTSSYRGSSYNRSTYSAPRSYSAPRTVVREYHTNTVHTQSPAASGGVHPLMAGMAGYMIGDAMSNRHNAQQPVYVQGQGAQPAQSIPEQQYAPQVEYSQNNLTQEEMSYGQHGFFYYLGWTLVALFLMGIGFEFLRRRF